MESHKRKSVGGSLEYMFECGDCKKKTRRIGELQVQLNLHDNIVKKCFFCPWVTADGKLNLSNQHLDHHFLTPRYKCTKIILTFILKQFTKLSKTKINVKIANFKPTQKIYFLNISEAIEIKN